MTKEAIAPGVGSGLTQDTTPIIDWQEALTTFLNILSSPRTAKAYQRAVVEAMEALGVEHVAGITPPMLATYRGGLVARLDTDREDRPSPATVNLKLAGLRQFLNFCRVTGITRLSKDVIGFVLKSPKAEVQKPYEVLNEGERRRLLRAAREKGPREYALVSLRLGAGLRVSELINVRLDDFSQDETGNWWVLVKMGKGRKDRLVPIAPTVMNAVRAWVDDSGRDLARKADRETRRTIAPGALFPAIVLNRYS